jgi:hypothetical protein
LAQVAGHDLIDLEDDFLGMSALAEPLPLTLGTGDWDPFAPSPPKLAAAGAGDPEP